MQPKDCRWLAKTNTKTQVMEYIYKFLAVRKAQTYIYTENTLDRNLVAKLPGVANRDRAFICIDSFFLLRIWIVDWLN